jgi:hypothetical protein
MVSSLRRTMSHEMPTATMAGVRMDRLPVISATMSITANGAREIPAEAGHHADDHIGGGTVAHGGEDGLEEPPHRRTQKGTDHHARPEDAPRTTRSDRESGGKDPGEGEEQDDPQRDGEQSVAEAGLYPAVAGADDLGDGDADRPHQ